MPEMSLPATPARAVAKRRSKWTHPLTLAVVGGAFALAAAIAQAVAPDLVKFYLQELVGGFPPGKVSVLTASYGVPGGAVCSDSKLLEQLEKNISVHPDQLKMPVDDAYFCPGQSIALGGKVLSVSWTCGDDATKRDKWAEGGKDAEIDCRYAKPKP
jgi:hypothetical protein